MKMIILLLLVITVSQTLRLPFSESTIPFDLTLFSSCPFHMFFEIELMGRVKNEGLETTRNTTPGFFPPNYFLELIARWSNV